MAQFDEVVALANVVRPGLEFGRVHFDDRPAIATGQVVVMRVNDASPKEALASVRHHHIDFATLHQLF